jgi:hypothetical protein
MIAFRRAWAMVLAGGAVACSVALDLGSLTEGCPSDAKLCNGACVPLDDPRTGCGRIGCAPCVVDHASVVACRTDTNECYPLACESGFGDCTVQSGGLLHNCQTNFNDDTFNCGSCGNKCTAEARTQPACGGGTCYTLCQVGWGDCDSQPADGCETDLTSSQNCGKCGNSCPDRPHTQANCQAGACPCEDGWADCNQSDPTDGCEAQLFVDPANCGGCGNACGASESCVNGACQLP